MDAPDTCDNSHLLALDEALTQLAAEDPHAAQVIVMKHFGEMTREQIADSLGLSIYQIGQKWIYGGHGREPPSKAEFFKTKSCQILRQPIVVASH